MFIETQIYKAFSRIINSESDYSNLKEYLNTQFSNFAGNKLNPSKLDVFASRFIGLKGPNVLSFLFEEKIDNAQSLYQYCYDNSRQIFHNLGTLHNEADDYFLFYVPLITFEVSNKEGHDFELDLSLVVTISFIDSNVSISHAVTFINEVSGDFHEIPESWDLSEDKDIDLIEGKLELGNVKAKKLCTLAEPLMNFLPADNFDTSMLLQDVSSSVATLVSERINQLTGHKMCMEYKKMFSYDVPKLHHYRTDFAVPEESVFATNNEDDEDQDDF